MKTRSVDRFRSKDYLKRAEECKSAMNRAFEAGDWNACVINAVHCAISSADAFCIFKKGLRNAGDSHRDSIALFLSIDPNTEELKKTVTHLSRLLDIKTDAEYGERLASSENAEQAKKHAERLFDFVATRLRTL
ncbi:MAG: HEPN domain-containing protein [Candidatus Aenigmarchaeota archaeon]|nr:HEPN domain-containing protein [Candidatus Aenigmarchaeota archaeon]